MIIENVQFFTFKKIANIEFNTNIYNVFTGLNALADTYGFTAKLRNDSGLVYDLIFDDENIYLEFLLKYSNDIVYAKSYGVYML